MLGNNLNNDRRNEYYHDYKNPSNAANEFNNALNNNINLLIKKLIEETDIMSFRNAKYFIPQIVSNKIIKAIKWNQDNIHLLLLFDEYCDNFDGAFTKENIDLLKNRLIKATDIMSFGNGKQLIPEIVSEKIIKEIEWNQDNIHLLLLLNEYCDNFGDALLDNIGLLKKRLIEETDIMSFKNAKFTINKKISEKIIKAIKWDKDNIHLLLLLNRNCSNFLEAFTEDNINLLKNKLPKNKDTIKAKITQDNIKFLFCNAIPEKIKNIFNLQDNTNFLDLLNNKFTTIPEINKLAESQSSLSPWKINQKYMIRCKINDLLEQDMGLNLKENTDQNNEIKKFFVNKQINIEQFKSLDISYRGMPPKETYSFAAGLCITPIPLLLKKYSLYNMENKKLFIPIMGIGALMSIIPIIGNLIRKNKDKENFTKRTENKNKIINLLGGFC